MNQKFIILVVITAQAAMGQNLKLPEDNLAAKKALEKHALFSDYFLYGRYNEAVVPLEWLLENTPAIHESLYINGVKILDSLQGTAPSAVEKRRLQEKIMELYDLRMKFFEPGVETLIRKALSAYRYFIYDEQKAGFLLNLFDEVFRIDSADMPAGMPLAYMQALRHYQSGESDLSREEILKRYEIITNILNRQTSGRPEAQRAAVDNILINLVDMDCSQAAELFGNFQEEDSLQLIRAKRYLSFALAFKCTQDTLFTEGAKVVYSYQPTYGLARLIANLSFAGGDWETAGKYYFKAVDCAETEDQQAESYYSLAVFFQRLDDKKKSRDYALKAANSEALANQAYELIGDLYVGSYSDCKTGKYPATDRAVFIVAYEHYKRAGALEKMKAAQMQFPSIEEIHGEDYREGQEIALNCWEGTVVALQRRNK